MQVTRSEYLAALRSGNYAQTQGTLHRINKPGFPDDLGIGFCCLGVYCDLVDPDAWGIMPGEPGVFHTFAESSCQLYGSGELTFGKMFGIEDRGVTREVLDHLAMMNDEDGSSFEDIATWLETELDQFITVTVKMMDERYTTLVANA